MEKNSVIIILLCCALMGCRNTALHNYQSTGTIVDDTIQLYQNTPSATKTNVARLLADARDRMLASPDLKFETYINLAVNHTAKANFVDYDIANTFSLRYITFMEKDAKVPCVCRRDAILNGYNWVLDWFNEEYKIFPYHEELIAGKVVTR
jgi:hypothetical protein